MTSIPTYRGRPLIALLLVLGAWTCMRAVLWDSSPLSAAIPSSSIFGVPVPFVEGRDAERPVLAYRRGAEGPQSLPGNAVSNLLAPRAPSPGAKRMRSAADLSTKDRSAVRPLPLPASERLAIASPAGIPVSALPQRETSGMPVHLAAAHQMLWMAALSEARLPMHLFQHYDAAPAPAPAPFYVAGREPLADKRWSGDSWLLLRRGGNPSLATGAAPATYGGSQAGAVLRYNLRPSSPHRLATYLRGTTALSGAKEKEVAIGLSARPVPGVPVVAAAELRATDQPGGTKLRPALLAFTQLPPVALPLGLRAEAYGQAGYVGGGFDTAFADGQARVDRQIVSFGDGELRAGAGAWGGAQKGASRLDVGPTASVGVPLGSTSASARVAVDWRFRVAGDAEPESGPAVSLFAGF